MGEGSGGVSRVVSEDVAGMVSLGPDVTEVSGAVVVDGEPTDPVGAGAVVVVVVVSTTVVTVVDVVVAKVGTDVASGCPASTAGGRGGAGVAVVDGCGRRGGSSRPWVPPSPDRGGALVRGSPDGELVATGVLPPSTVSSLEGDDGDDVCVPGAATARGAPSSGASPIADSRAATARASAVSTVTTSTGCARITTARPFASAAPQEASARGG